MRNILTSAFILLSALPAFARDNISVAGSSTVLPYATIVAEQFMKTTKHKVVVESGGSSAGLKLFCSGVGPTTIDIANSSRQIRSKELDECKSNGVTAIEYVFGFDGIVLAVDVNGPKWNVEPKDVYLAMAAKVPLNGQLVDNPYKTWKDVNSNLPDWEIDAYIPGEKHGTREVFEEKLLSVGCKAAGGDKLDAKQCARVRKDGRVKDIDGDYTETLARLNANKKAVGVFGLSFYENNTDKLQVATVNGIKPSLETIQNKTYPVSRPLYFYVKQEHLTAISGLKEYVEFFMSNRMIGSDGPLVEYGLVPLK